MANGSDSGPGSSRNPRLFIREMVMRNFKSYAGEQRVGPFHKVRVLHFFSLTYLLTFKNLNNFRRLICVSVGFSARVQSFSAVVGPNGSGKSNVIDAMLFVFGKRAKQVYQLHIIFIFIRASCLSYCLTHFFLFPIVQCNFLDAT